MGQALCGSGSADVAPDPDRSDATSPILRHFQELKKCAAEGERLAYACSATEALAGDGPIAAPHTAPQDEQRASERGCLAVTLLGGKQACSGPATGAGIACGSACCLGAAFRPVGTLRFATGA